MGPNDLHRWFQSHETHLRPRGLIERWPISRCSGEYNLPDDDYKDDDRRVRLVLAPHLAAYLATVTIIVLISDLFL
jgi:hypothetical protein